MKLNNGFKPLTKDVMQNQYGGWAWLAVLAPWILQGVFSAISSFKMLESDKGYVKYKGIDAHWENHADKSKASKPTHITYSF